MAAPSRGPTELIGRSIEGCFICRDWELRVTQRCLEEDLDVSGRADFASVEDVEIVKAFKLKRFTRDYDTRQVAPLTCGRRVWVLARGNDHRGGTWHDEAEGVIWLLAASLHRSGSTADFFPRTKRLDAEDRLLPTEADYERLFRERDLRFVYAIRVEAPPVLDEARAHPGEHHRLLGGLFGASVTVEVDHDLQAEAITVALEVGTFEYGALPVILTSFAAGNWEPISRMPGRDLEPGEIAFTLVRPSA